jgi:competence protein ComEA
MSEQRNVFGAFLLLALAVIVGGIGLLISRPRPTEVTVNPPAPTSTPQPTATPSPVRVYVTGAVQRPRNSITLPPGSRVEDAIAAAGGALDDADLDRINLASRLNDGDQIHVPTVGQESPVELPTASGSGGLININTATIQELETLPRIGPAVAQRIVEYREASGPFPDVEALTNVSGIGPSTLDELRELITVGD